MEMYLPNIIFKKKGNLYWKFLKKYAATQKKCKTLYFFNYLIKLILVVWFDKIDIDLNLITIANKIIFLRLLIGKCIKL